MHPSIRPTALRRFLSVLAAAGSMLLSGCFMSHAPLLHERDAVAPIPVGTYRWASRDLVLRRDGAGYLANSEGADYRVIAVRYPEGDGPEMRAWLVQATPATPHTYNLMGLRDYPYVYGLLLRHTPTGELTLAMPTMRTARFQTRANRKALTYAGGTTIVVPANPGGNDYAFGSRDDLGTVLVDSWNDYVTTGRRDLVLVPLR